MLEFVTGKINMLIMNIEIERKFLVKGEYKQSASKSYRIVQAYIPTLTGITVRIRIKGDKGYITIKGKNTHSGLSRYEWEKEIPVNEATELLTLCFSGLIEKTRYEVEFENQTYEVDEFYGENEGLTIAELEFESETASYSKPDWLGDEVTGDKRYYNSYLSQHPFKYWQS
jgi:adenylate cyclase